MPLEYSCLECGPKMTFRQLEIQDMNNPVMYCPKCCRVYTMKGNPVSLPGSEGPLYYLGEGKFEVRPEKDEK